jgi:signal transduction histidine kinase
MQVQTAIDRGSRVHLPEEVQIFAFRAASEFLFNCLKHAGTKQARLAMGCDGDRVTVTVEDEGSGFDRSNLEVGGGESGGSGLRMIRHRARLLGGDLEVDSARGSGTRCRLTLPNRSEPEKE